MKTSTIIKKLLTDDFLEKVTSHPVWDASGNIVALRDIEIQARKDALRAAEAMHAIIDDIRPGDEAVLPNGLTMRQHRILTSPPPIEAHMISTSVQMDPETRTLVPRVNVTLPLTEMEHLLANLFPAQYSFMVESVDMSEKRIASSGNSADTISESLVVEAKAVATIELTCLNGRSIRHQGVGFVYSILKGKGCDRLEAIQHARRMAYKGSVTDAKKDALRLLGRVFQPVISDASALTREIERILLERIQEKNKSSGNAGKISKALNERRRSDASSSPRAASTDETRKTGEDREEKEEKDASLKTSHENTPAPSAAKSASSPSRKKSPESRRQTPTETSKKKRPPKSKREPNAHSPDGDRNPVSAEGSHDDKTPCLRFGENLIPIDRDSPMDSIFDTALSLFKSGSEATRAIFDGGENSRLVKKLLSPSDLLLLKEMIQEAFAEISEGDPADDPEEETLPSTSAKQDDRIVNGRGSSSGQDDMRDFHALSPSASSASDDISKAAQAVLSMTGIPKETESQERLKKMLEDQVSMLKTMLENPRA